MVCLLRYVIYVSSDLTAVANRVSQIVSGEPAGATEPDRPIKKDEMAVVPKSDLKKELEALIKTGEKNRMALAALWKKVESLDAAIQHTKRIHSSVQKRNQGKN